MAEVENGSMPEALVHQSRVSTATAISSLNIMNGVFLLAVGDQLPKDVLQDASTVGGGTLLALGTIGLCHELGSKLHENNCRRKVERLGVLIGTDDLYEVYVGGVGRLKTDSQQHTPGSNDRTGKPNRSLIALSALNKDVIGDKKTILPLEGIMNILTACVASYKLMWRESGAGDPRDSLFMYYTNHLDNYFPLNGLDNRPDSWSKLAGKLVTDSEFAADIAGYALSPTKLTFGPYARSSV